MNIEEVKYRVRLRTHMKNLCNAPIIETVNYNTAEDDVIYLLSIIEEALKHSNGAPYESSFENKDRLLEVRNILQGDE